MPQVLSEVEIRDGWTTNVTLKTLPNGNLELKSTTHKHHFVGRPVPDNLATKLISLSAIHVLYAHESTVNVFKVRLLANPSKELVFKRGDLLDELNFFLSLPESKHLIRPTHAVVDESNCLRGMLLENHPQGDLEYFYSSYRPAASWITIPSYESDVLPPPLTEELLLPVEVKLAWAHDIADALAWLHERNVFWGDLKSQNVILCDDGRCRFVDYCPADVWSPIFSPPEMATVTHGALTPGRDVFSLGMTLWTVVEEVSTFEREPQYVRPNLPWRETTPSWFVDLVHTCIATDPAERPSASSVRDVLHSHVALVSACYHCSLPFCYSPCYLRVNAIRSSMLFASWYILGSISSSKWQIRDREHVERGLRRNHIAAAGEA